MPESSPERAETRAPGGNAPDSALPRFSLPEVVGVAMSAEAIAEIVQRSVEEMAAGLECSRLIALAYHARDRTLRGVTVAGFALPDMRALRLSLAEFPAAERAIRMQRILSLPAPDALPEPLASCLEGQIVLVPLALGERPLALLVGQVGPEVAPRSAAWLERAEEIAARAALAVEMQRLASAYQDELRLRQSTRAIASAILAGYPLSDIGAQIIEVVGQRLGEERIALFLGDIHGIIQPVALRNVSLEYGEGAARLARRSPLVARARASDLPVHARNVQENPRMSEELRVLFRREGITSILIAVLRHGEAVTGALVVYPREERSFTPAELAVFQSFADQAALAVAFTQLLEQQRVAAMAEERNRLAREMHDTVAQSLATLVLQLQTTLQDIAQGRTLPLREMLEAACAQAKRALEDTRRAVQGLAPASLERLTPGQAIAEEARQFEAQEGIAAPFVLTGEEQALTPDQRATLLRIAQEALTNARKHAKAQRVRVGLQYGAEEVVLLVEDDGIGFDTAAAVPGPEGGYGLFGMTERARLLGGDARVESTPGWGTRIQARLPYRPSSPLPQAGRGLPAVSSSAGIPPPAPAFPVAPTLSLPLSRPQAAPDAVRVLIVDDHAMTRQGVRAMLEASGEVLVTGEAADGAQAVERARALRPDVVLMDLQMPGADGLEGLRRLHAEQPDLPVVILTTFQTDASVKEALSAGARGYLIKDAGASELIAGIRAAHRGETLLAASVASRLAALTAGQDGPASDALNERERQIVQLLAQGARNKEIAARLFLAPKTVEYHLSSIYSKLGVSNRTEAARAALERGLVIAPPPATR